MSREAFNASPVKIGRDIRAHLRRALDDAAPRECCGVLLGDRADSMVVVMCVLEMTNAVNAVGGFAIPDREIRRARALAAGSDLKIVAVFHSHPDGRADPSVRDLAGISHSEWPWVIVTAGPETDDVHLSWHSRDS